MSMSAPAPRSPRLLLRLAPFLLLPLAAAGCDELTDALFNADFDAEADAALAALELTTVEAAIAHTFLDGIDPRGEDEALLAAIANAASRFEPASCVNVTTVARTSTFQLDGCEGPYGLGDLTGTIVVIPDTAVAGAVAVSITSTRVEFGTASLALSSQVDYVVGTDGSRQATIVTGGGGTASDGTTLARAGSFQSSRTDNEGCLTLAGLISSTIGESSLRTIAFANVTTCPPTCPSGQLTFTEAQAESSEADGFVLTLNLDGSTTVNYATTGGELGRTGLVCEG